jgi:hypothetical protein
LRYDHLVLDPSQGPASAPLLIIDDLGMRKLTATAAEDLLVLYSPRSGQ